MFFWWMPFMPALDPVEATTDPRSHAKEKTSSRPEPERRRLRSKAKTKRKVARKAAGRKGAARKSARKARTKGR
jgi:hypothetical protein